MILLILSSLVGGFLLGRVTGFMKGKNKGILIRVAALGRADALIVKDHDTMRQIYEAKFPPSWKGTPVIIAPDGIECIDYETLRTVCRKMKAKDTGLHV